MNLMGNADVMENEKKKEDRPDDEDWLDDEDEAENMEMEHHAISYIIPVLLGLLFIAFLIAAFIPIWRLIAFGLRGLMG